MIRNEKETKNSIFDEELEEEEILDHSIIRGKIQEAFKCDFNFSDLIAEMYREAEKKKESLMIEDIIDIYNHKYNTYEDYVRTTRYLIEEYKKRNSETIFEPHDLTIKKSFYIEPVILSKNVFETAYNLGEERKKNG